VLYRQGALPGFPPHQQRLQRQAIEQIGQHRQTPLRVATTRARLILAGDPAKLLPHLLGVGQVDQRTVDAHQTVTAPAFNLKSAARPVHRLQDRPVVQFDQSRVTQLEPRLAPGRSRDGLPLLSQAIEKLVQVQLHRPNGLLQQKHPGSHKTKVALASEVLPPTLVPIAETGAAQDLSNGFDNEFTERTVIEMFLHPQGNAQKYIRCTYYTAAFTNLMTLGRASSRALTSQITQKVRARADARPPGKSISARATSPAVLATRAVSDNTQQKKAINV